MTARHKTTVQPRPYRFLVKCTCGWHRMSINEATARALGARHEVTGQ